MNNKIDFLEKAKSYEKEAIETLQALLRIPSVYDRKTVFGKDAFWSSNRRCFIFCWLAQRVGLRQ